ncbi:hypothetical protein QE152_g10475 [Popillia japonica]|uniref:Uncharacterized protein n=1 Tax=Popillia japonica TaxID=7064 RepID=A0AAW1LV20_POPJA
MSYTRRGGNFGKQNAPLSAVGQRRGFPNTPAQNKQHQQHQVPPMQQPQNLQAQQQQFQSQLQQQEKARAAQQQAMQNQQSNQQPKPQAPKPTQAPPAKPPPVAPTVPQQNNLQQAAEQLLTDQSFLSDGVDANAGDSSVQHKPRPFWMKRNGRINRAERAKRRNVRLRKLLQPKNALMIINELVGHVSFEIAETKTDAFDDMYRASVSVEGKEYAGVGKSKALAKTSA